ncbi:hypothetical protein ACIQTT_01815 [Microbacterium sp. NPDC090225]|uniref:hypothetical protein n=1 Tax=Microbacterium sp. NPDC090225 TaxID=3364207 RepID=UPI003821B07E
MSNLSEVRGIAAHLTLTEVAVGTDAPIADLRALKSAIEREVTDPSARKWLDAEHYAGSVLLTAASLNKRAAADRSRNAFDRQPLSTLVSRFNGWADQLRSRIDEVVAGTGRVQDYSAQLAAFRADPVNVQP